MEILDHHDLTTRSVLKSEPGESIELTATEVTEGDEHQGIEEVSAALDSNLHYQLKAEMSSGQVTYRVLHLAGDGEPQSLGNFSAQQNGDSSPLGEKIAYIPSSSDNSDVAMANAAGQLYVMMSPQDMNARAINARTGAKVEVRTGRDERRRATHNEVERRRRDKINSWILQLSKLIPDCATESKPPHTVTAASKGGILAKACDYITELRNANNRLAERVQEQERHGIELELMRQQCDALKQENLILRTQLQQNGFTPSVMNS